jgi:RNA polymerase sporulation-specific sigma factor
MQVRVGGKRLILAAQKGDDGAFAQLTRDFRGKISGKARQYWIKGAEREDLVQEGYIGLWKAVRDYDSSRGSFTTFADLCITRQIISAVKGASRRKHQHLNEAIVMKTTQKEDVNDILEMLTDSRSCSAEEVYLANAQGRAICSGLAANLSPFEADTLRLIYNGHTYLVTAERLGKAPKAVDNALQRVRRKYDKQVALAN